MQIVPSSFDKSMLPPSIVTQDPYEVIEKVGRQLAPHHMKIRRNMPLDADLRCAGLGPVSVVYIEYGAQVEIEPSDTNGCYLVHSALTGITELETKSGLVSMRPDNLLVTSPNCRPLIRMTPECRHLTVRIDAAALNERARALFNMPITEPIIFDPEVAGLSQLPVMWRDLLFHICRQHVWLKAMPNSMRVRDQYAAILMDLLISNQTHNYSDRIRVGASDISPWHVRKARAIIDRDLAEPLPISALAARVGVSVRSLQNGFKQFLGVTPVEYVRRERLSRLHQALQSAEGNPSVTEIMLDSGIANFGRYAHYYKQRYGCSPSETLRRNRR